MSRICALLVVTVGMIGPPRVHGATPSAPRPPQVIPQDDPYLPSTAFLTPDAQPDPIHNLDSVRTTWWDNLPTQLVDRHIGDSPGQRVIFRDTLTGAEVWLICRSPGDEYEGFYSSLRNFNADGSMLEIDRFLMTVTGARPRPLSRLISRDRDRSSIRGFQWDPGDPASGLCKRFSGAIHRFNIRTDEETPVFSPGTRFPNNSWILLTHDGRHMLVAREKNDADPFLYLADGRGNIIRKIELRTRSQDPTKDHMGGLHLYQDQGENLYIIYSLNKAAARTTNPHQKWFAALDGSIHVNADDLEGSLGEGYLINGKRRLLTPAGYDPMTTTLGHAGMSPSEHWRVQTDGAFMTLTDLRTHDLKHLAHVPSADHFDWSAPVDWFMHRTRRQPGLPIYRVEVPSGTVHRIVASNTDDHLACFSYSHPSPDGTKCLYRSSMLGNLDMYLAVIRHPEPPRDLRLSRSDEGVRLEWKQPERGREIRGYRVYRSARSGGPYEPVNGDLVTDESYVDRTAPDRACYVITSVEHSGLESRRFSSEVALDRKGLVNLYIEAETAALTSPMREVFVPPSASANYAITRAARDPLWQPTSGPGKARWQVSLPLTTNYTLWARVRARLKMGADVTFSIDGKAFGRQEIDASEWTWLRLPTSGRLTQGRHVITAAMAQSNCELDKLLLTSDPKQVPESGGNLPNQPPSRPDSLRVEWDKSGRHVILQWSHSIGPLQHHFDVYRGDMPDFKPSQRTLLGSPTRNAFIDPQPPGSRALYYRVVAVDTWGNRSAPSVAAKLMRTGTISPTRIRVDLNPTHLRGSLSLTHDPEAAGKQCVVLGPSVKKGSIEIPLTVPPGRYLLWVRARSQGRYQTARLEIRDSKRTEKCVVIGAESKLFGDPIWSWRRVQSLSSSTVPRRTPTWITVSGNQPELTIRFGSGYVELDQIYLTTSVHDLPDPAAVWFSPTNAYRFRRSEAAD